MECVEVPQLQFIDEATNRLAWAQGHYTEAELIDSASSGLLFD